MKLTNRLGKVASLVNKGATLVDIGCDHGFLSIFLLENQIINKAYACDINQGPLNNVKENVKKHGLNDKIECILSDGLKELTNIEFDTVVIAGMGGSLIVDILEEAKKIIVNKQIIVQPNINSYGLRKWLIENNFKIDNEILVDDNNIIYEIIEANQGCNVKYNDFELSYGKINLSNESSLLINKMNDDLNKYQRIIKQLPKDSDKYIEFNKKILEIEEYLK
ncbi:tRNA (adenine22-N1)-methyltransferase [Bacilli bacterium PM5-3]|nr:tRNA (adenine22-N1)-methyltransferase [Bacilli bacterium PM5-3]MDH6602895.1 tRNA (adenine22-N1)-methyltransferase [Bacilli bacterium PM5-9]